MLGEFSLERERSAVMVVDTVVEKCFEDGSLDRGAAGLFEDVMIVALGCRFVAVVVVVVP